MLIPCEVAVKCVIPVLRAMIAKNLMTKHRLKQLDVANLLGVSQSAVSLYGRKIRGKAMDLETEEEIVSGINDIATGLAEGELTYTDFTIQLCRVCRLIRSRRLMCKLHEAFDPKIDIERCKICALI